MLNDLSSTLALLETRRSGRPRDMIAPGPSDVQIERILGVAARTPDHGKLFPWRFVTVALDQRQALADVLARALPEHDPKATSAHFAKALEFAHQAPALVVVVSSPVADHKISLWEQQLSAGAASMNLLVATHAMGFVGGWLTGWAAYSETVRAAFCAPGERIVGFFFLGSPRHALEERPRAPLTTLVRHWGPPSA
ncbi:MAG: nitroreductase [Pseudomonadota bacterium]|nr:nitroreductase [Pseudomonadota bacterium]